MKTTEKIIKLVKEADIAFENAEVAGSERHGKYTTVFFHNGSFNLIAEKSDNTIRIGVYEAPNKEPKNEIEWYTKCIAKQVIEYK